MARVNPISPVNYNKRPPRARRGQSTQKFLEVAIRKNAQIMLMIHATGAHGFENTNDDARSREILKAAIEFMKTQVQ